MTVQDQFGRNVNVPDSPQRIISLVPSQTEFLADINLETNVVGITRFCVRPSDWFYSKARVGGTKDPDVDRILALKPDLILANAEENTKETVAALEHLHPVWVSDVNDLGSALQMMQMIGNLTWRHDTAKDWVDRIQERFRVLSLEPTGLKVLYLIWKGPWMAAGKDTFISSMIAEAGFENVVKGDRYPELTMEEIHRLSPDLIFLSSEPYPFSESHAHELQHLTGIPTHCVDGEMFSWYGTRLLHSATYFAELRKSLKLP